MGPIRLIELSFHIAVEPTGPYRVYLSHKTGRAGRLGEGGSGRVPGAPGWS
jgi:hypothetical protein